MSEQPSFGEVMGQTTRRAWLSVLLTNLWIRAGVLTVLVVVGLTFGARFDRDAGIDGLRATMETFGPLAAVVFVAIYAVAGTIMLPAAPFSIAAGVLFGAIVGSFVAFVGVMLGCVGAFWVGRALGRDAVERIGGRHVAALDRYLTDRGFASVLFVRLAPMFPYNVINVCAGVSGMPLRPYVLASMIGVIPGTIVYATLGGTIDEPASAGFVAVVAIVAVGAGVELRRRAARAEAYRQAAEGA